MQAQLKPPSPVLPIAIVIALLSLHASADYLLQAYQHGWSTWWDLHGRAAAWPWYLDFLPRDAWHLVQSVRNHSVILAVALLARTLYRQHAAERFLWSRFGTWIPGNSLTSVRGRIVWLCAEMLAPLALYGATRAVFFSVVKALLNG